MRVVTLLPAATEIVAALGGADRLVGISHECDYPATVLGLPRVTATPIDSSLPSAGIDAEVRRLRATGRPVIGVDADALRRLAPDLLVTQSLCEVCAVADGEAHRLAAALERPPEVLRLGGTTLAGIWSDIRTIGAGSVMQMSFGWRLGMPSGKLSWWPRPSKICRIASAPLCSR